jgi:type I restriction enzyme S subunit
MRTVEGDIGRGAAARGTGMNAAQQLLTEHIDIWTAADTEKKSGRGRASGSAGSVYGIKKLRELILELAVRGKLVLQDSSDEPASELLKRIQTEKAKLIASGKIKKSQPLPPVEEQEIPFNLPRSWEWVHLPEIYYSVSVSGNQLLSSEIRESGLYPVVDQGKRFIAGFSDDASLLIRLPGPVVVFGDHTTERKFVDFDFIAGADGVKILRPILQNERFFWLHLVGLKLEGRGYARHFKVLNECLFAMPPTNEQARIVAKVDELMALCDQLETQHTNAVDAHEKLVSYLLGTPTQSQDAEDFSANWLRIAAHFETLFTTETSIDVLKRNILELAATGKLSFALESDTPIARLVEDIVREKKAIGRSRREGEAVAEEHPSSLRTIGKNRAKLKARFFCDFITKGTTPGQNELLGVGDVPFLKVYNIVDNQLDFQYRPIFISKEIHDTKLSRSKIFPRDVIMNIVGPPLGKVAIISDQYPEWNMNQALAVFRPLAGIFNRYIFYMLSTESILRSVLAEVKGTAGQDNLSLEQCRDLVIPIPSVEEQHRIVAKVDELMALCDQLKSRITDASQLQQKLADVMVEQAVA